LHWTYGPEGKYKKYTDNFGVNTSRKAATWKTEQEMEDNININMGDKL